MISKALKLIRQYHKLNQTELAGRLSISVSYLSELEAGKKEPSLDILQKYADCFKVPLSSLVVFSETLAGAHSISKAGKQKREIKVKPTKKQRQKLKK